MDNKLAELAETAEDGENDKKLAKLLSKRVIYEEKRAKKRLRFISLVSLLAVIRQTVVFGLFCFVLIHRVLLYIQAFKLGLIGREIVAFFSTTAISASHE